MNIHVDPGQPQAQPRLADPENFRELSIVAPGGAAATGVPEALAKLGRLDGSDHVFVEQALLIRLAGPLGNDPEWSKSFHAMIEFAASHGWLADDGAVRVHVEADS